MERMKLNALKSFLGKNVNLHLKDGSVIINVRVENITRDKLNGNLTLRCVPFRKEKETIHVLVKNLAWAETINPLLLSTPRGS